MQCISHAYVFVFVFQWKDMDHFKQYIKSTGMDVQMEYLGDQQLLALQVLPLHTLS